MAHDIDLFFPHGQWPVQMPAVPRKGERIEFNDPDMGYTLWNVTGVEYYVSSDGSEPGISITLDPANEGTRELMEKFKVERRRWGI